MKKCFMPYTIEDHNHRLAAWAASSSASASKLWRFKVEQGVAILEAIGFTAALASPDQLPSPREVDQSHRQWREDVIGAAHGEYLQFSHGIAAKLINCYLKVRFVCAHQHEHPHVKALHPPIDETLLRTLASHEYGGHGRLWRKFREARWSKYDSETYQQVIDLIRQSLPAGEPLWKIEQYWDGYQ